MTRLFSFVLMIAGLVLLLAYSPFPSGVVRYGFLIGLFALCAGWLLGKQGAREA